MRRWNGWGDNATSMNLGEGARAMLAQQLGPGHPGQDARREDLLARIPPSRLPEHPLIDRSPEARLPVAWGESYADWIRKRLGHLPPVPDGVAFVESGEQVRTLLDLAHAQRWVVIPFAGGTSVSGHLDCPAGDRPVLSLHLGRLNRLLHLDKTSQLATFGAGTPGPLVESQLRAQGYTLGHFPQSFEYSTVGGWVVTRSSGQQSLRYGRIEQLFAGGRMETPVGTLALPTLPASSAGPDLREIVLGSEGRFGVLTEATVRVSPLPGHESFHALFLPDWDAAEAAVKASPDSVSALSRRGDAHLFLGRFREARADFDEMIRRDPRMDAPHWRLGIALYFLGEFAQSAAQFEKYHRYDARDRENGIWHFFGRAKIGGLEKARLQMLVYEKFDREPFPMLYDMFAGRKTTDELLAHIAKPALASQGSVQFFGLYYAGVNEALLGRPEKGRKLTGQAVAHPWGKSSEGGPGYMWNVARLSRVELFTL